MNVGQPSGWNSGMLCMQELFLDGWVEVGHCVTDVFIFVKKKKKKKKYQCGLLCSSCLVVSQHTHSPAGERVQRVMTQNNSCCHSPIRDLINII